MEDGLSELFDSSTLTFTTPEGFGGSVTIREKRTKDVTQILASIAILRKAMQDEGHKAVEVKKFGGGGFKKEIAYVEGRVCPKCGEKLVQGTTKTGKPFIKCSTQKYDFTTKSTTGCSFVEWTETEGQEKPATPKQKEVIENLQMQGKVDIAVDVKSLTFTQASEIIKNSIGK